jgi:hypothetical protein
MPNVNDLDRIALHPTENLVGIVDDDLHPYAMFISGFSGNWILCNKIDRDVDRAKKLDYSPLGLLLPTYPLISARSARARG